MERATFRIEHGEGYSKATSGTDTVIEMWCNDHCDLLHVKGEKMSAVVSDVREIVGVQDVMYSEDETVVITGDCLRRQDHANIETYLTDNNCLMLPPLRYRDGAKFCRVLALDKTNLTGFYRDVNQEFEISVESKQRVRGALKEESPLRENPGPDLSPRQAETLKIAKNRGYYEIPRLTTTKEIAEELGVERRTAEEHLRRAEKKVVESLPEPI